MALKQRDGSYAVVFDGTVMTPQDLRRIAEALERHGAKLVKFSESQRMVVVGVDPERLNELCEDAGVKLAPAVGNVVRSVKFCPGSALCTKGFQDSIAMAEKLKRFEGVEVPDKMKIAISGCPNSCTEPAVRDIGLMGTKDGFTIFVGGSAGRRPRIGWKLAEKVDPDRAVEIVERIVEFYKSRGRRGKRLGDVIEEIGFEEFKREVL